MTDLQRNLELEQALETIFFAIQHLDRAAVLSMDGGGGKDANEKIALAHVATSRALRSLSDRLRDVSGEHQRAYVDVPF